MNEILRFDPEGLMPPKLEEVRDDVDRDYSLHINGLTEDQFEALSKNLTDALRGQPKSLAARVSAQALGIAFSTVVVAGCLYAVSWLVTNLPGR
jgi:hypothetical protein